MFLAPQNTNHIITQKLGQSIIISSAHLNYCWERITFVKELMHLLDGADEAVDTGETFDIVLTELAASPDKISLPTLSEHRAFWMAMGVLVPEHLRISLKARIAAAKDAKAKADVEMAAAEILKIPRFYVPFLFSAAYEHRAWFPSE